LSIHSKNETLKEAFDYTVIELIGGKNSSKINGLKRIYHYESTATDIVSVAR